MRLTLILAASALALGLAGCGDNTQPPASAVAERNAAPSPTAAPTTDHSGMAGMDHDMSTMDAADDANTTETADGFTFHTIPAKVESVHLPSAGAGVWTATASDAALVAIAAGADATMPDGAVHHVIRVTPQASGNADVKFERHEAAGGPAVETRTIHFMIH
jgi:hypothetical protein